MIEIGEPDWYREAERRIDWVVAHPGMSDWLKDALRSARRRDPLAVVNDVEILRQLLLDWSSAIVQTKVTKAE